jgi:hypothetical protein
VYLWTGSVMVLHVAPMAEQLGLLSYSRLGDMAPAFLDPLHLRQSTWMVNVGTGYLCPATRTTIALCRLPATSGRSTMWTYQAADATLRTRYELGNPSKRLDWPQWFFVYGGGCFSTMVVYQFEIDVANHSENRRLLSKVRDQG